MKKQEKVITYISCMSDPLHKTPCHACPHGSPALETHPGRTGLPNDVYSLLIASTDTITKF